MSYKALAKLKALKNVYQDFEVIDAGEELTVKIKLLNSEEETEVHAYSIEKYDQGIGFLYAVKRETICRAIVQINKTDIPEIVEDEENKEKSQRHIWIRENIVSGWSQILIDEIWKGYSRLTSKVESKILSTIKSEKTEKESEVNE